MAVKEMIRLFPDQERLLESVRDKLRTGKKSVLMQAATGAGKTIVASAMIDGARRKGSRCMMVVPRRELLKQTAKTFEEYDVPFSFCAAGRPLNLHAQTFLATSGTLLSRIRAGKPVPDIRLLIVDETHHGGKGLDEIIEYYKSRNAIVVGLSATPERLDGKGLGCWYDDLACGESMAWLIENKRLSDYRLFAPSRPDLSGIKTVAGDYAKGELAARMLADRKNIGDAVKYYRTHAMGKLNVTYTTSLEHNELCAAMFNDGGIPSAVVDGKTSDADMRRIIQAYARREILNIVNCELLTFGFDLSSASGMDVTVESMTDLRPTQSLALQLQKWGRVLRRKDTPALIFDHGGNAMIHGLPDDDRQWTLSGRTKKDKEASARANPVRQCPECFFAHHPTPACPACGHEYQVDSRMVKHEDGELSEVTSVQRRPFTPQELRAVDDMMRNAIARGVPAFAAKRWAVSKVAKGMA